MGDIPATPLGDEVPPRRESDFELDSATVAELAACLRNPVRPDIRSNVSCKNSQRFGVRKVMESKDEQVDPTSLFSQEEID